MQRVSSSLHAHLHGPSACSGSRRCSARRSHLGIAVHDALRWYDPAQHCTTTVTQCVRGTGALRRGRFIDSESPRVHVQAQPCS